MQTNTVTSQKNIYRSIALEELHIIENAMEFSKTVQLIFTASFVVGRGGGLLGSDWCWILRILNLMGGMGVWGGVCVGWGGWCVWVCVA